MPFPIDDFDYRPKPKLELAVFANGVPKTPGPPVRGLQLDHCGARDDRSHQQSLVASKGCIIEAGP